MYLAVFVWIEVQLREHRIVDLLLIRPSIGVCPQVACPFPPLQVREVKHVDPDHNR